MFKDLAEALPDLLRSLRRAGFAAGTDQYLSALDLLGHLYVNEQTPTEPQIRAALAGIFSTNPYEQARFGPLFDSWLASLKPKPDEKPQEPVKPLEFTWPERFKQHPVTTALPWLVALLLSAILAAALYPPVPEPDGPSSPGPGIKPPKPSVEPQITEPSRFLPPPRQPLDTPLPTRDFYPWWGGALALLWLLPVFAWLGWTLWLVQHRFLALRRQKVSQEDPITLAHLTLTAENLRLFEGPRLEPFWRSLRRFRARQSKRLDIKATVDRMLRNGGFFEPRYRQRALPPAYLALVDRRHSEDHSAGFAMDFIAAMRHEHLHVVDLHYRYDPRHSRAPYALARARGPTELISLYPDHDLVLSGEGEALDRNTQGDLSAWVRVFAWWPRKWLLSPAPLWPRIAFFQRLAKTEFRITALSTHGLAQLEDERVEVAEDDPHDLPLPERLGRDPLYWVQEHGVSRKQAKSIVGDLQSYMGREGFLLLAATASYPELRWQLTRALDLQLKLDPTTREWRLRKLARLPWFRQAYMPDVIRYALFVRLPKRDIRRLSDVYEALFQHRQDKPVHFPVAVPDWEKSRGGVRRATQSAPIGTPLADRVLAAVIRGRRPKPLEFALPFNLLNRRVAQDWRALWLPLFIGALLAPAALWLNLWFWQAHAERWVQDAAAKRMRAASAGAAIDIRYVPQTRAYAQSLAHELKNRGFNTVSLQESPTQFGTTAGGPMLRLGDNFAVDPLVSLQDTDPNVREAAAAALGELGEKAAMVGMGRLEYGVVDPRILSNVRAGFDYITYGAGLKQQSSPTLAPGSVRLALLAVPNVFQDALAGLGSAMVIIPGGCFQMGSFSAEPERIADEQPHRVCVEKFMMSRFEVTFAEYDAFAAATKRDKPDDVGWGRGRRPVINVTLEDAMAYAAWLSEQTGETYRLPTEAEWEYAARAGTTTPFWFGETINPARANYNGTVSYNGGATGKYRGQTVEVGQFEANAFGVYDVHGNVWEWTCSAYDRNYQGGEENCAAADAEVRRVLRGGSWGVRPGKLRSAFRDVNVPTFHGINFGFRLARELP